MQIVRRVTVIIEVLALVLSLTACSNYGDVLKHKAVADEAEASRLVAGFTDEGRALYHRGLQHIANVHQTLGQFTIRQVIAQEMTREKQRDAARQAAADRAAQLAQSRDATLQALSAGKRCRRRYAKRTTPLAERQRPERRAMRHSARMMLF
jgi:hypothetical protein